MFINLLCRSHLLFQNENVNEDMISVLRQFFSYLPKTGDGGVEGQLFSGDQLIVEKAMNVIFFSNKWVYSTGSFRWSTSTSTSVNQK